MQLAPAVFFAAHRETEKKGGEIQREARQANGSAAAVELTGVGDDVPSSSVPGRISCRVAGTGRIPSPARCGGAACGRTRGTANGGKVSVTGGRQKILRARAASSPPSSPCRIHPPSCWIRASSTALAYVAGEPKPGPVRVARNQRPTLPPSTAAANTLPSLYSVVQFCR